MWLADSTLMSLVGQGAFELYGQPKWTCGKNTCNTYEVFAEVLHLPEGQDLRGYDYIGQIAANKNMVRMFSDWFLEESLAMMRRLIDKAGCDLITAVNTWPYSINQSDFVNKVEQALKRHNLQPRNLEYEISGVDQIDATGLENLRALKEQGVTLLLDNFGIGDNNLFALTKLPFDGIKLARCFAEGVPQDEKLVRILVSVAHLADTLGITVCAKGIENGDQFEYFNDLGYFKGQGYMIGAPMPEDKLCEFITQFAKKD